MIQNFQRFKRKKACPLLEFVVINGSYDKGGYQSRLLIHNSSRAEPLCLGWGVCDRWRSWPSKLILNCYQDHGAASLREFTRYCWKHASTGRDNTWTSCSEECYYLTVSILTSSSVNQHVRVYTPAAISESHVQNK